MARILGDRLRIGIAGLRMGAAMLDALARHPRAEMCALCDPLGERVYPLTDRYGVPTVYADYDEMLASERLDGVYISTPNRLHTSMVPAALARRLHVMCEKPHFEDGLRSQEIVDATIRSDAERRWIDL